MIISTKDEAIVSTQNDMSDVEYLWGAVAQWLERATDNRVVAGSNPTEAVWNLW